MPQHEQSLILQFWFLSIAALLWTHVARQFSATSQSDVCKHKSIPDIGQKVQTLVSTGVNTRATPRTLELEVCDTTTKEYNPGEQVCKNHSKKDYNPWWASYSSV